MKPNAKRISQPTEPQPQLQEPEPEPSCGACAHAQVVVGALECHANPPAVVFSHGMLVSIWPQVQPDKRCGCWKPSRQN